MIEPTAADKVIANLIYRLNKDMKRRDAIQLAQLAVEAGCISEGEGWLDTLDQRKQEAKP